MFCSQPLIPLASVRNTTTHDCGFTRTVDVHVDGLVVAFRLQKEQLGNHQTCHRVIDLSRGIKKQQQKQTLFWSHVNRKIVISSLSFIRNTYRTHNTNDSFSEEARIDVIGSFSSTL